MNTIAGGLTKPVHSLINAELARNARRGISGSDGLSGQEWAEITASAMKAAQAKIAELQLPSDVFDSWMRDFCQMTADD